MQQDQPAAPAGGEDVLELVVLAVAVCCGVGSMLLGAVRLPTAADERAFWRSQRTRRLLRWYDFAASVSIACVQVAMIAKIKVADAACRSAAAAAAAAAAGPVPSTAAGKWPWPLTGLLGRPPPPWLGAWPGDIRCDLIYTNGFRLALCLSVLQLTWLCCAPRAYDQHRMAWALFSRVWKVLYIQVIGAAAARGEAGWEALMASVHSTAAATGSPLHGALSLVFAWSGSSSCLFLNLNHLLPLPWTAAITLLQTAAHVYFFSGSIARNVNHADVRPGYVSICHALMRTAAGLPSMGDEALDQWCVAHPRSVVAACQVLFGFVLPLVLMVLMERLLKSAYVPLPAAAVAVAAVMGQEEHVRAAEGAPAPAASSAARSGEAGEGLLAAGGGCSRPGEVVRQEAPHAGERRCSGQVVQWQQEARPASNGAPGSRRDQGMPPPALQHQ